MLTDLPTSDERLRALDRLPVIQQRARRKRITKFSAAGTAVAALAFAVAIPAAQAGATRHHPGLVVTNRPAAVGPGHGPVAPSPTGPTGPSTGGTAQAPATSVASTVPLSGPSAGTGPTAPTPTSGSHPGTTVPKSGSGTGAGTTTRPQGPGYLHAEDQWLSLPGERTASLGFIYQLAAQDLQGGESSDTGDRSGYAKAISELTDLEGTTTAAGASGNVTQETEDLNVFFGLPANGQHACDARDFGSATSDWMEEPDGTASGVVVGPLQAMVTELQELKPTLSGDTSCIPALIDDLQDLAAATPAEVAASDGTAADGSYEKKTILGAEIGYINGMIDYNGGTTLSPLRLSTDTEPNPY